MDKWVWKFWLLLWVTLPVIIGVAMWLDSQPHKEQNVLLELDVKPGIFYRNGPQFAINSDFSQPITFSYSKPYSEIKSYPYVQFKGAVVGPFDEVRLDINHDKKNIDSIHSVNGSGLIFLLNWEDYPIIEDDALIALNFSVFHGSDIGTELPITKDITFDSLMLQTDSLTSRWQYLLSWFHHQPAYHLSSLNFWQKQGLPVPVAVAFMVWLTFVLIMGMWVWRVPTGQLLLLVLLILSPVFVAVINKQLILNSQVNDIFNEEVSASSINPIDHNIRLFSEAFSKKISNSDKSRLAVVVQINQSFEQSRLLYHLSEWNVFRSLNWGELFQIKEAKQLQELFVIYAESRAPQCQSEELNEKEGVELLMAQFGYCVVKL